MTKTELINRIYDQCEHLIQKKVIEEIVGGVFFNIEECIKNNEAVTFTGLMNITYPDVAERTAHNPHTGEEVVVPAHKGVKVKVSKVLRDLAK